LIQPPLHRQRQPYYDLNEDILNEDILNEDILKEDILKENMTARREAFLRVAMNAGHGALGALTRPRHWPCHQCRCQRRKRRMRMKKMTMALAPPRHAPRMTNIGWR
jgi:hypothetical protein